MQAYRYNWPAIVVIDLQTLNIYYRYCMTKVELLQKIFNGLQIDFRLQTFNFKFCMLDSGLRFQT